MEEAIGASPNWKAKGERANCTGCHTVQMLEQQRLTGKQWAAVIKKMQGWGAPLEGADADLLARYAEIHFGAGAPAYQVPAIEAELAQDALSPMPDGVFGQ